MTTAVTLANGMSDTCVSMLNAIGSGVADDTVGKLLQTPDQYNHALYQASINIGNFAVKPVATMILAVIMLLEFVRITSKADGDDELGVKMVITTMFKGALVVVAIQSSDVWLKMIDYLIGLITSGIPGQATMEGAQTATALGDQMRGPIEDGGWATQAACMVLLIIPFFVSKLAEAVATVVILLIFVQFYMMNAFSPLPLAFLANETTRPMGVGFFKSYLGVALRGACFWLGIYLYRVMVRGVLSPGSYHEGDSVPGWVISNFVQLLLASILLVGMVMIAQQTSRSLSGGE